MTIPTIDHMSLVYLWTQAKQTKTAGCRRCNEPAYRIAACTLKHSVGIEQITILLECPKGHLLGRHLVDMREITHVVENQLGRKRP